jgi:hypothetical protein
LEIFFSRRFVFFLKGDAGDSLYHHNQSQFTTKDSDNDGDSGQCAVSLKGAWWYNRCYHSNLNGLYLGAGKSSGTGMQWRYWHLYQSMKKTEMKIRPSQF